MTTAAKVQGNIDALRARRKQLQDQWQKLEDERVSERRNSGHLLADGKPEEAATARARVAAISEELSSTQAAIEILNGREAELLAELKGAKLSQAEREKDAAVARYKKSIEAGTRALKDFWQQFEKIGDEYKASSEAVRQAEQQVETIRSDGKKRPLRSITAYDNGQGLLAELLPILQVRLGSKRLANSESVGVDVPIAARSSSDLQRRMSSEGQRELAAR